MIEASDRYLRGRGIPIPFLATFVLAAAAILWVAPRTAAGDYRDLLVTFIVLQSLWIVLFWRMGVYLFMAYVVFEGFLINYFNGSAEMNLVKDVFVCLLFGTLAVVLVFRRTVPFPHLPWMIPFAGFALVYAAEAFNPYLPTILVGLVGIRVTLLYSVLASVAYWFFDTVDRVVRFFFFMVVLSIPVALFGIVQYIKGPGWLIGLSPGFQRAVFYASINEVTGEPQGFRTISTFVHTGGFSQYLAFVMLLTAAFWGLARARTHRLVIAAALMLQFFALLTTGGRASFFIFFACVGFWFFFQRASLRMAPALFLLPLFFYGATLLTGSGFFERFSTLLDLQLVRERNMPLMTGWLTEAMKTDWAGLGAGCASIASRHVGETPLNGGVVENGLARIRYEAGVPGLVLYVMFLVTLGISWARQAFSTPDPRVRWFSSACAAFLLVNLMLVPIGTPFDVSPTNIYLWFFAGFLGRAPLLLATPGGLLNSYRQT